MLQGEMCLDDQQQGELSIDNKKLHVEQMEAAAALTAKSLSELSALYSLQGKAYRNQMYQLIAYATIHSNNKQDMDSESTTGELTKRLRFLISG